MTLVFNKDQLAHLSRGNRGGNSRGVKWSNESFKKGLQFWFSCGSTGYAVFAITWEKTGVY